MIYLPDNTPTSSPHDTLPGLPSGPDRIDTSELRALIPALIAQIAAMVCPAGVERGALSRLWEARRLFADLFRAEVHNLSLRLISAMQADRVWQAQVLEDLGGEAALQRWDKRYAKMMDAGEAEPKSEPKPEPKPEPDTQTEQKLEHQTKTTRAPAKLRTDRHDMFRLAPLSKKTERTQPSRSPMAFGIRDAAIKMKRPKPIALTPDQLRMPELVKLSENSDVIEGEAPLRVYAAGSSNNPHLTREAILAAWERIFGYYTLFNFKIMNLDLMITVPVCRQNPLPV